MSKKLPRDRARLLAFAKANTLRLTGREVIGASPMRPPRLVIVGIVLLAAGAGVYVAGVRAVNPPELAPATFPGMYRPNPALAAGEVDDDHWVTVDLDAAPALTDEQWARLERIARKSPTMVVRQKAVYAVKRYLGDANRGEQARGLLVIVAADEGEDEWVRGAAR